MKKSDLKTGMWVKTRDGDEYMVLRDVETKIYGNQEFCLVRDNMFICGYNYNDNLKRKDSIEDKYDIVSVHGSGEVSNLTFTFQEDEIIWKREDKTGIKKAIDRMQEIIDEMKESLNKKQNKLILKK